MKATLFQYKTLLVSSWGNSVNFVYGLAVWIGLKGLSKIFSVATGPATCYLFERCAITRATPINKSAELFRL